MSCLCLQDVLCPMYVRSLQQRSKMSTTDDDDDDAKSVVPYHTVSRQARAGQYYITEAFTRGGVNGDDFT